MSITIEFTPDEQKRVAEAARKRGMDPAEFVKRLVTDNVAEPVSNGGKPRFEIRPGIDPNHFYFTATREEFNAALDEIAQMNKNLPVLTDAAFDRENLYDEDRF